MRSNTISVLGVRRLPEGHPRRNGVGAKAFKTKMAERLSEQYRMRMHGGCEHLEVTHFRKPLKEGELSTEEARAGKVGVFCVMFELDAELVKPAFEIGRSVCAELEPTFAYRAKWRQPGTGEVFDLPLAEKKAAA